MMICSDMCSFLFLLSKREDIKSKDSLEKANKYMKRRGPDATYIKAVGDVLMLHNLLHITGTDPCYQPYNDNNIWVLFNGEIFNYLEIKPEARCDTECIVTTYKKYGDSFPRYLDGEFAIVLYDVSKRKLIVTSDTFMTKPLHIFYSKEEIAVASYASCINALGFSCEAHAVRPNTTYVFQLGARVTLQTTSRVFDFDLRQYKEDTKDWAKSFINAVKKRATHGNTHNALFVPMSSGYDSGGITLALNVLGLPYATYSSFINENASVINQRIKLNELANCSKSHTVDGISNSQREHEAISILENTEPFTYIHDDSPNMRLKLHADGGARAANYIYRCMSQQQFRIVLSGSGADEIMTDYGFQGTKICYHSEFGGMFPNDLSKIFPWRKFYDDSQRSYLFKDEYIAGTHHIEGRYPFLDPQVVQEWLWLAPHIKNNVYKRPIKDMFDHYEYPYVPDVKTGFCI